MNWADVKYFLSKMTPEQLSQPAQLFDPYFNRVVKIEGIDSLASIRDGNPSVLNSPVVLIGSKERE